MKLTKSDLKAIVKECLIEILSEGIGFGPQAAANTISSNSLVRDIHQAARQSPVFSESKKPSQNLKDAIKREAGGNKIMESILADTAESTLPNMLKNDRGGAGYTPPVGSGLVENVVAAADPEQLFGEETTSKWANLAFMGTSKK